MGAVPCMSGVPHPQDPYGGASVRPGGRLMRYDPCHGGVHRHLPHPDLCTERGGNGRLHLVVSVAHRHAYDVAESVVVVEVVAGVVAVVVEVEVGDIAAHP